MAAMTAAELHREVGSALDGPVDGARLSRLAVETRRLADMVGWAPGAIDPDGHVVGRFEGLRATAMVGYKRSGEQPLALIHDALADLITAIVRHDRDLDAGDENGDDGEAF
jgi:hypothetical protein